MQLNYLTVRRIPALLASLSICSGLAVGGTTPNPLYLRFKGHYRSVPKTTMESIPAETVDSIASIRQMVPSDPEMRLNYSNPDISNIHLIHDPDWDAAYNHRLPEEQRVVEVIANLYAYKLENGTDGDNDLHLIVGDTMDSPTLMNMEVSGVPKSGVKATFVEVRREILEIIGNNPTKKKGSYRMFKVPVRVKVRGSLYFDADHSAGDVGPEGLMPATVWEVHPVHSIRPL